MGFVGALHVLHAWNIGFTANIMVLFKTIKRKTYFCPEAMKLTFIG